jgi:hypothetical protein
MTNFAFWFASVFQVSCKLTTVDQRILDVSISDVILAKLLH